MRVLFLNESFLYYTGLVAKALAEAGNDIVLIAPYRAGDFRFHISDDPQGEFKQFLGDKVRLEWVDIPADTNPRTIRANLSVVRRMTNLIRRFKPDVIHVHDMADYRYLLTVAICRKRFPIVMTVHNAEPHLGKKDNRMEFLRPYLRRMSDRYIVHGQTIKEHLLRVSNIPAEKVDCISHVAFDFYRSWMTGRQDDGRTVLFFGGVFRYKGIEYLIKAAPSIRSRFPDARIVIAGSGPDWPRCRSFIEDPGAFELIDRALTNPEVTQLFEEASVVVLPYTEASQSGVLAVAYAMGKPVVATTVGSLPEGVQEGVTGLLVPPADSDALAQAIITLLEDDDLRRQMGQKAFEKATIGDFSPSNIAMRTQEVYKCAIEGRNRTTNTKGVFG